MCSPGRRSRIVSVARSSCDAAVSSLRPSSTRASATTPVSLMTPARRALACPIWLLARVSEGKARWRTARSITPSLSGSVGRPSLSGSASAPSSALLAPSVPMAPALASRRRPSMLRLNDGTSDSRVSSGPCREAPARTKSSAAKVSAMRPFVKSNELAASRALLPWAWADSKLLLALFSLR